MPSSSSSSGVYFRKTGSSRKVDSKAHRAGVSSITPYYQTRTVRTTAVTVSAPAATILGR